jgi:hypothetical protein
VVRTAAVVLAVGLSGCGGASAPSSPGSGATTPLPPVTRVFASNLEWIDTFTMSASGTLSARARLTPTRGILPATVVAAAGTRLYLSNLVGIEGFRIDPDTGGISPLPGSPFNTERGGGLLRDPLERYVWQRRSGGIQAFRIDASTGQLSPSGALSATSPFLSTVETQGRFAYGLEAQQLAACRVEQTGVLTPLEGSPWPLPREGVNPTDLRAGTGTAASLLFFISQGDGVRSSSILVYRLDPTTGVPQPAFVQPVPADRVAEGLVTSPSGAFLYVPYRTLRSTDERPALVVVFAIEAISGRLTEVASVAAGPAFSSDVEVAPDGSNLFVTLEPSPFVLPLAPADLAVFHVEGGTTLTPVAGSPYRVGPDPHTIHVFQTQPTAR